jgi:hypothetical protein
MLEREAGSQNGSIYKSRIGLFFFFFFSFFFYGRIDFDLSQNMLFAFIRNKPSLPYVFGSSIISFHFSFSKELPEDSELREDNTRACHGFLWICRRILLMSRLVVVVSATTFPYIM